MQFSEEQIKYMRDRFLNWTFPRDWNPDGGISFQRSESAVKYNHPWPVGTNLLDAVQAEEMVRHMVDGIKKVSEPMDCRDLRAELDALKIELHSIYEIATGKQRDEPITFEMLREQVAALIKERDALKQYKQGVDGIIHHLIESDSSLDHEWAGDKHGWGFAFEWIKWIVARLRAEQRIPPFVYYVGGVNREPLRHCVWGYFHEEQRALEAAHNNETDINEAGYYPFALVAKVREGMVELPEAQWWFAFDGTHYNRIETPEWTKRYGWLGFPTAAALKRPRGLPDLEQRIPPGMTAEKLDDIVLLLRHGCGHPAAPDAAQFCEEWATWLRKQAEPGTAKQTPTESSTSPEATTEEQTIPGLPEGFRIARIANNARLILGGGTEYALAELEPIAPQGAPK